MKKTILLILLISALVKTNAQDYLGLSTGNYSGIHGVLLQPASVADNRYKFEFNVVSTSFNFQNNFIGLSRDYFVNNRFSFKDFSSFNDFKDKVLTKNAVDGNNVYFNINNRLNLPSILLTTGKKSGIAFNFQSRTSLAFNNINPQLAEQAYEGWDYAPTMNRAYNADGLNLTALNWFEAGLTYGRVLVDNDKHFFKAGATAKYLGGVSSWYLKADKLSVVASNDTFINLNSPNIEYGHSATNISSQISTDYRPDANSIGYDFGVVYEFRGRADKFKFLKFDKKNEEVVDATRRDKNKYTLKLGVSLLDVGTLKFKSTPLARDLSANINGFNLWTMNVNNVQDFDTLLSSLPGVNYTGVEGKEYSVAMPTALSGQLDWHLVKGFYINAMAYMPFTALNKNANYRTFTPNYFAVTPRWESRVAGIYVPLVLNKFDNAQNQITAGATLRIGPAFVGTANLLTLVQKDNIKSADFHAGLKLPLAFGKPSKASQWFENLTNKETETQTVEKTVIVKDEQGNDVEKKVIVEERKSEKVIEKEEKAPVQPIQIIINNYGSSNNGQNRRQSIDVNPTQNENGGQSYQVNDSQESINVDYNHQENAELFNLQDQIEYLKFKLKQKETLINELEKQQEEINNGTYNEESKKKINSLKEAFVSESNFIHSRKPLDTSELSAVSVRARLFELKKELLDIDNKNAALDQRMADQLEENERLLSLNSTNLYYVQNMKGNSQELLTIRSLTPQPYVPVYKIERAYPNPSYNYSEKPVGIISTEKAPEVTYPIRRNTYQIETTASKMFVDTTQILTKTDARNIMTKNDYQNLREEIRSLKNEVRQIEVNASPKRRWALFGNRDKTIINIDSSRNIVQDVKIVRDTIYVDRPVEKIITKIVRDTITNTIEKNNIITKTETKEVKVDNTIRDLLERPALFVLFDVGKFNIKPIYNSELQFFATQLKKYPSLKIELTGHTDATGQAEKNLILSQNRAKSVSNYLISKGVNRDRIITKGLGADDPLADNQSPSGKSQNRRVELKFID